MIQQEQSASSHPNGGTEFNSTREGNKIAAELYDTETMESGWDSPERAQKLVEPYVHDGSVVLDIGIGTGQAVRGYAEKGAVIIGLDHDLDMLSAAKSLTGESGLMRQADINERLPIDDLVKKVDVVQAVGVLEFAEDLGNVVEQVSQVLATDGVFVFTVETLASANGESIQQYADLIIQRHTADEICTLLRDKGFTSLSDESYGGYERGDTTTEKVPYHIFLAQKQN